MQAGLAIQGGVRGAARASRQLGRTFGSAATVAYYGGKQVLGKRLAAAGRFLDAAGRFEVLSYVAERDLERAAVAAFGPVGSIFLYNRLRTEPKSVEILDPYTQIAAPTNVRQLMTFQSLGGGESVRQELSGRTTTAKRKPSQIPAKQKKRMWRMGLRWCRKHQRYDKCSLRAR